MRSLTGAVSLIALLATSACDDGADPAESDTTDPVDTAETDLLNGDLGTTEDLAPVGPIIYVDGAAPGPGTGAMSDPYPSFSAAVLHFGPVEEIVLASGTYDAPTSFAFANPILIRGAGSTETTLAPSAAASWTFAGSLTIEDLALAQAFALNGSTEDLVIRRVEAVGLTLDAGDLSVEDVTVEGGQGIGLDLTATTAALTTLSVANTTADENGNAAAIVVRGGTHTIAGLTVDGTPDQGLVVADAAVIIADEVTLTNGGARALLHIGSGSWTGTNLDIGTAATCVFASDNAVVSLTTGAVANCNNGILASNGADITLAALTLDNCAGGHVSLLNGVSANIDDVQVSGARESCINLSGTGVVSISNSTIEDCVGSGIGVLGTHDVTVDTVDVSIIGPDPIFNVAAGLSIVDGTVTLTDVTVHDLDGKGISAIRSTVLAERFEATRTGDAGISLLDPGNATSILTDPVFTGCTASAVTVFNAVLEVTGATITDTIVDPSVGLGDGVSFGMGANVSLTGSTITGSALNGVSFFDGATGLIDGNEISASGQFAVIEFCGVGADASVVLGNNVYADNVLGDESLCP